MASLLLGCNPSASTQPPEDTAVPEEAPAAEPEPIAEGSDEATSDGQAVPPPSDGGEPTAVADAGSTTPAEPEPAPATEPEAAPTTEPAPAPAPATEPKPAKQAKPTTASLELPKPLHGKTDASCGNDPGVGERLKAFSLPGLEEGKQVTQGTFRGRVLVVNFWGTWCKPCLKELPEFDQLYRRYRKHGMTLLAIATDEDAAAVKELVDKRKIGAKIAIAGEDYAGQYGSPKFPFTFVVDHKGVIQASYRGYKPECLGQLEADIREQLQERAEAKAKAGKG